MNFFLWKYKQHNDEDIKNISEEFSVPISISTIMSLKKINTKDRARTFFYNNLNQLHNPLLMKDMSKAIKRIVQAKDNNELVLIIGDYDTDGTTAASILHLYFKSLNLHSDYLSPP